MNERELDELFGRVREETPADAGAAERFLAWHRANLAEVPGASPPLRPLPAARRAVWWPALLASAAVLTGALMVRPSPELPTSAAYDAYQGVLGEGW
ncbi:hypothetical protein [Deinococcus hopiensis]|uniref:Uncharacterized protein n=1 Tax=Deinococcus hopiensis KR-140 TaxID=695939 RepID=A0A1W1VSB9_9DEIO|nr:hypothetical protein [Deinococcus hopiensis]SMB96239.1 hypothetical protein SAMN00790413_03215 [Deinococcus hopiensis KR-140]